MTEFFIFLRKCMYPPSSPGKRKCAENAQQVLKVLSDLLGHENQEVSSYKLLTNQRNANVFCCVLISYSGSARLA